MSDHYNETLRLARLIGLDHHASDTLRTVWRLTPRTDADATPGSVMAVPWRPFEDGVDASHVREWMQNTHPEWWTQHCRWASISLMCRSVLAAFDPPEPTDPLDGLTPEQAEIALAELAERLAETGAAFNNAMGVLLESKLPDNGYAIAAEWRDKCQAAEEERDDAKRRASDAHSRADEWRNQLHRHTKRHDLTGWWVARENEDGSLLLQSSTGERRTVMHLGDEKWVAGRDAELRKLEEERNQLKSSHGQLIETLKHLRTDLDTARETNQRLNRRCQQAEAMETVYNHAANVMRAAAYEVIHKADGTKHWLDRLRRTVHDREKAAWVGAGVGKWMEEAERLRAERDELRAELDRREAEDKAMDIDVDRIMSNMPPLKPGKASIAISRLRTALGMESGPIGAVVEKAADAIERLTIERNELRAACRRGRYAVRHADEVVAGLETELRELQDDYDGLQALFDLQHTRVEAATKLWQAAHGQPDVLPDLGTLAEWLMRERAEAIEDRDRWRKQWEAAETKWDNHVPIADYTPSEADAQRAADLFWRLPGRVGVGRYAVDNAREWLAAWQKALTEPGEPAESEATNG